MGLNVLGCRADVLGTTNHLVANACGTDGSVSPLLCRQKIPGRQQERPFGTLSTAGETFRNPVDSRRDVSEPRRQAGKMYGNPVVKQERCMGTPSSSRRDVWEPRRQAGEMVWEPRRQAGELRSVGTSSFSCVFSSTRVSEHHHQTPGMTTACCLLHSTAVFLSAPPPPPPHTHT